MTTREPSPPHRPPLGAHRLLGQGVGAALLRPTGEIDWWCPDRFDATPLLWSLLDPDGASARWLDVELATWDGQPAGPTARTALRHGAVMIDTWDGLLTCATGTMLVRLARSRGPDVTLTHELRCGGFDGEWKCWTIEGSGARSADLRIDQATKLSADGVTVLTSVDVTGDRWSGLAISTAGRASAGADTPGFDMPGLDTPGLDTPGPDTPGVDILVAMMSAADEDEEQFLDDVRLPHDHPSRVLDALRVLRALTDPSTGAAVASPTTSLPEAPGASRQYDYRFAWLRDSAYAASTAAQIGRVRSSTDYLNFVGDLLERYGAELGPMTTTRGDIVPAEREVVGVSGWGGSTPIRVGNLAAKQTQMDSMSTVLEAVAVHVRCGGRMTARTWKTVDVLANLLADAPHAPSSGIWELREPRLLVTEELARWIGLDKAIRLKRIFRPWLRRRAWVVARATTRHRIESVIDPETGMLPQSFDRPFVADAATLLACTNKFLKPRSERAKRLALATVAALEEGPFIRRYPAGTDDIDGVEAAFVPASWWAVSALAVVGELAEARRRADDMCSHLSPLQPEQWSIEHDEGLGNTPLLWSHTEAARALYNLHSARIRHRYGLIGLTAWRLGRYARLRIGRSHDR